MSSRRAAGLIAAGFGLAFVLANAGEAGAPWALVLRIVGGALFVQALVRLLRAPDHGIDRRPTALRIYWVSVATEVVAFVVGARLLAANELDEYVVPWVVLVVGLHFLPFAWAFHTPDFARLGVLLIAVAGVAAALGAGDVAPPRLVAGVGAGLALLVFAWLSAGRGALRNGAPTPVVGS